MDEMFASDDVAVVLHLTSPISVEWCTRFDKRTDERETEVRPGHVLSSREDWILGQIQILVRGNVRG